MLNIPDIRNVIIIKTPREFRAATKIISCRHIVCEDGNVIFVWCRKGSEWVKTKYVLFGEDRDRDFESSGFEAYKKFYTYCGVDEINKMKNALTPIPIWESQEQMHYANIDFVGQKLYQPIYEFDANSAFTYGTLKLSSDFDKLKEYMLMLYDKKKTAATKLERSRFKNLQNYLIGYFANIKQLIRVRSDVILQSNLNIKRRMGEITRAGGAVFLSNTDSIVTDEKGAEVMQKYIGNDVGEFKLEQKTDRLFYNSSNSYQLGNKVVWSGVKYFARKNTNIFEDRIAKQNGTLIKEIDFHISENDGYKICRITQGVIVVTVTNLMGELIDIKKYKISEV